MIYDIYVLDTYILGKLTHPNIDDTIFIKWFQDLEYDNIDIVIPEIADYELRRELLRLNKSQSLRVLDEMKNDFSYLPITTDIMLMAAELWAEARNKGYQSASNDSLDGDVILAAQTIQLINAGY